MAGRESRSYTRDRSGGALSKSGKRLQCNSVHHGSGGHDYGGWHDPNVYPREHLAVTGHWEDHTTHRPQFRAEFLERVMPSGAEAIETYLSSRAIKGIGPRTASRIVKLFGDQTFEIMEQHPERLAEVPGISPQKAKAIGAELSEAVWNAEAVGIPAVQWIARRAGHAAL